MKCPGCQKGWGVEWDTEYGDPLQGDFEVRCPNCSKEFTIDVELHEATYRVMEGQ